MVPCAQILGADSLRDRAAHGSVPRASPRLLQRHLRRACESFSCAVGSRDLVTYHPNGCQAYATEALSSEIKISLVDELGVPLDESVSRVGDRPTRIDSDCYVDDELGPYRLQKTLTAAGTLNVTRIYTDSGCLDRQLALAPIEDAVMPACWDRNASIDALASCYSVDGREKKRCVAVAYSQTGYIVQCYGAFALDNHCGTFLEVHEPNSQAILSQVRLLGEYTSGFRATILPLFFAGDRTRTICKGDYELWWVLRTRYNYIVQKRKRFRVINPPCDFDSVTNEYRNYHTL